MSNEVETSVGCCACVPSEQLRQEFQHLRSQWLWLFLFGVLLVTCGAAAVISPTLTVLTTFAIMVILGVTLMVAGIATIVTSFWAGKWSGMMVQLLVGIIYLVVGSIITDKPGPMALGMTMLVAAFFIVAGIFRIVASITIRFPHWGWSLLNGVVTLLLGVVIYRHIEHVPQSALWIIGLLVGLEMLFNGWTWIMLSLAVRNIPEKAA